MLLQKINLSTVRSIKCLMKVNNISNKVMSLMDFLYGRKENKTCFQVESFKFVFQISKYIWEIHFHNKVMSLMDFLYSRKENKTCFQVESFKFVFLISKYIWEIYFLNILQLNVLFFLLVIKYLIYLPIYLSIFGERIRLWTRAYPGITQLFFF